MADEFNGTRDKKEILRLIREQTDAYNHGNASLFLSSIAEDRISLNPNQPTVVGRGDEKELQDFFDRVEQYTNLQVDELVVFGDWAFERGSGEGTLTPKSAAEKQDPTASYSYKYIRVWNRRSEGWKVVRSIWNTSDPL